MRKNLHYLQCLNFSLYIATTFLVFLFIQTLSRIFFFLFNKNNLKEILFVDFIWGVRFDLPAIVCIYSFFWIMAVFFANHKKLLAFLCALSTFLIVAPNAVDWGFFPFSMRRSTADIIPIFFKESNAFSWGMNVLKDYFLIVLIALSLVASSTWIVYRILSKIVNYSLLERLAGFLILIPFLIIGWRGGLQLRPLSRVDAFVPERPFAMDVRLNTTFSILKTLKTLVKEDHLNKITEIFELKNVKRKALPVLQISSPFANNNPKPNIIIIVVESLSSEYLHLYNPNLKVKYAPFIDSIGRLGVFVKRSFANARRSIDGIPAILCSLPAFSTTPFIYSPYVSNNYISSIAYYLRKLGYDTYFMHGGIDGTLGLNNLAKISAVEHYIGKKAYDKANPNNNDFDGNWGIYDCSFLSFCADVLDKARKPFFSFIFTLSSHHPYKIPEDYAQTLPYDYPPHLKAISYADLCLKNFFNKILEKEWFNNTIFVITSDHSSIAFSEDYFKVPGIFAIPIIFYSKGVELPPISPDIIGQQIDILPSVVYLAGYEGVVVSPGKNLFEPSYNFAIFYNSEIYYGLTLKNLYGIQNNGENIIYCTEYPNILKTFNCQPSNQYDLKEIKITWLKVFNWIQFAGCGPEINQSS